MKKENPTNQKAVFGLICIIILLLVSSILYIFLMNSSGKSYTAVIYQNGKIIETIDLSAVTESYRLTLETENGGYNIVEIKPEEIAVADASCPDHICVKQGFIRNSVLPITCLPNKLVIQLEENTPGIKPDIITY